MFLHVFVCDFGFSTQNHGESCENYVKRYVWIWSIRNFMTHRIFDVVRFLPRFAQYVANSTTAFNLNHRIKWAVLNQDVRNWWQVVLKVGYVLEHSWKASNSRRCSDDFLPKSNGKSQVGGAIHLNTNHLDGRAVWRKARSPTRLLYLSSPFSHLPSFFI